MLEALVTRLNSLGRRSKNLFQLQPKPDDRLGNGCKAISRNKRSSSHIDMLTSSFAAMEVSTQFKQVFKIIDANGDGTISSLELSEVLLCLGSYDKSKATEEAEEMVRQMDCNGDGVIDLDEFMGVVNMYGAIGSEEDHLRDAFLIFDSDNNGLISAKELQHVLLNLGCTKCSLEECKQMIKGVDRNGDGFVDFKEFRLMMKV